MKIKRILHVIGKMDRAGAETMVMNLYRTIDRTEFQFDFISFSKDKGDFDDEIKSLGGKIFTITCENSIKRMFALKKFLVKYREYSIVHCHTLFSNSFHLWAAHMAKVPNRIAHSHNTSDKSKPKLIGTLYQYISRKLIKKYATNYIGCGRAAANFLFPEQKEVMVLSNAIDANYFAIIGETKKDYIKNEFNLKQECLKIIQVGRLQQVKNPLFSIQIAKELKNRGIIFKFLFIGQGELHDTLKKEIELSNLKKEVFLVGVRSDIPELMAGADILLMPSLYEGFPVVLVESQSVGLKSLIADSISYEVDLGVDLIEFESLNSSTSKWVDKLLGLKLKGKINKERRIKKMVELGFDIHESSSLLTNLYKSMV
jgi:glycosyltransferase EpsF